MKTQFFNTPVILILWIIFSGYKWCGDFTDSKETTAGDLVIWAYLIYDSGVFQMVHLHVPFDFSNGIPGGFFDPIEFQSRPCRIIP